MATKIQLINALKNKPYAHTMGFIAEAAVPPAQKEWLTANIDFEKFAYEIGNYISEAISFDDLMAHGARLKNELATKGFITDIETGKALTIQESLSLLRVYGTIEAAGNINKSGDFTLYDEAMNPDEIQLKKLEEIIKEETKTIESKLDKTDLDAIRKGVDKLNKLRAEVKELRDKMDNELENKIKEIMDILYQILRVFQVASITTVILSGNFVPGLAVEVFTKAYFCHPVVIAAIIADIIWIIGPKNIPILKEVIDLADSLVAKLGVVVVNSIKSVVSIIRDTTNKVTTGKMVGESMLLSAEEINKRMERSKDIPEPIKEILNKNKDINNFSKDVFSAVVVDLKKDAIETDNIKRKEEDEIGKIKTDITDAIIGKAQTIDPNMATGLLNKLGSDELADIPNEKPEDDTSTDSVEDKDGEETSATDITPVEDKDGDGNYADDALVQSPLDDTSDEEAAAMKSMAKLQESPLFKRRSMIRESFAKNKYNVKSTSYIDVVKATVINSVVNAYMSETEK